MKGRARAAALPALVLCIPCSLFLKHPPFPAQAGSGAAPLSLRNPVKMCLKKQLQDIKNSKKLKSEAACFCY